MMKSSNRKLLVGSISMISALGKMQGLDSAISKKLAMHDGRGRES